MYMKINPYIIAFGGGCLPHRKPMMEMTGAASQCLEPFLRAAAKSNFATDSKSLVYVISISVLILSCLL